MGTLALQLHIARMLSCISRAGLCEMLIERKKKWRRWISSLVGGTCETRRNWVIRQHEATPSDEHSDNPRELIATGGASQPSALLLTTDSSRRKEFRFARATFREALALLWRKFRTDFSESQWTADATVFWTTIWPNLRRFRAALDLFCTLQLLDRFRNFLTERVA